MRSIIPLFKSAVSKQLAVAVCSILACAALAQPGGNNPESTAFSGKVVETMNAASYTYVRVDTGKKKLWAAAPKFAVKPGDKVDVTSAMPMANYESKTLKRKFDLIYFTGSVSVNGKPAGAAAAASQELPPGHPKIDAPAAASVSDFSRIEKPPGGQSVSEIVDGRKQLKGKEVTVRGKVVKYNEAVMGKNWLHVRDGSGTAANNDLTVTTQTPAKVGATVLVKGKVSTERNFGGGYFYPVIIEDAQVTVE